MQALSCLCTALNAQTITSRVSSSCEDMSFGVLRTASGLAQIVHHCCTLTLRSIEPTARLELMDCRISPSCAALAGARPLPRAAVLEIILGAVAHQVGVRADVAWLYSSYCMQ